MLKTLLAMMIFLVALSGCGGESRIEAPGGASDGEPAEDSEGLKDPAKPPSKPARAGASLEGGAEKVGSGAGKAKDSRPSPEDTSRPKSASAAPAAQKKSAAAKSLKGTGADPVTAILNDLKRDPQAAKEAFLKIWEISPGLIPRLIDQVENDETSKLEQVQILVLDPDFLRPGEIKPFLANRIHGLGRMELLDESNQDDIRLISQEYTKMSYGITPNKHYKVVLEKFGGFPIGVVVRAGLINRFRSTKYPPSSDDEAAAGKLTGWWRDFYALTKASLKDPSPAPPASPPAKKKNS